MKRPSLGKLRERFSGISTDWASLANYLSFAIIGLGFLALYLGWNGAANKACVDCQIPYLISGGMVGIGLIATGIGVLVVQTGRRNKADIEEHLRRISDALERSGAATRSAPSSRRGTGWVVAGSSSFHRPDCRLVEGRGDADLVPRDDARRSGLAPCRVCSP